MTYYKLLNGSRADNTPLDNIARHAKDSRNTAVKLYLVRGPRRRASRLAVDNNICCRDTVLERVHHCLVARDRSRARGLHVEPQRGDPRHLSSRRRGRFDCRGKAVVASRVRAGEAENGGKTVEVDAVSGDDEVGVADQAVIAKQFQTRGSVIEVVGQLLNASSTVLAVCSAEGGEGIKD